MSQVQTIFTDSAVLEDAWHRKYPTVKLPKQMKTRTSRLHRVDTFSAGDYGVDDEEDEVRAAAASGVHPDWEVSMTGLLL